MSSRHLSTESEGEQGVAGASGRKLCRCRTRCGSEGRWVHWRTYNDHVVDFDEADSSGSDEGLGGASDGGGWTEDRMDSAAEDFGQGMDYSDEDELYLGLNEGLLPAQEDLLAGGFALDGNGVGESDSDCGSTAAPTSQPEWLWLMEIMLVWCNVVHGVSDHWVQPFYRLGTSSYSCGVISVRVDNLPFQMRNSSSYTHVCCILPGPQKPTSDGLQAALEIIVTELHRLHKDGIQVDELIDERTRQPLKVRIRLARLLADTDARTMTVGFPGHSSKGQFCPWCTVDEGEWVKLLLRGEEGSPRSEADHRRNCLKALPDAIPRLRPFQVDALRRDHAAATCVLYKLPGWSSLAHAPVDVMHNLDLGLCKHFWMQTCVDGSLIDSKDLQICKTILQETTYPTGITRISPDLGQTSGGTPTAAGWSILSQYIMPVLLASSWATLLQTSAQKTFHSKKKKMVKEGLAAIAASSASNLVSPELAGNASTSTSIHAPAIASSSTLTPTRAPPTSTHAPAIASSSTLTPTRAPPTSTLAPAVASSSTLTPTRAAAVRSRARHGKPRKGKEPEPPKEKEPEFTKSVPIASILEASLVLARACRLAHGRIIEEPQITVLHMSLVTFATLIATQIGSPWVTYNYHIALHIADHIRRHGPAWAYWSYPQERSYGLMKRIRTNKHRGGELEHTMHTRSEDRHRIMAVLESMPVTPLSRILRGIIRAEAGTEAGPEAGPDAGSGGGPQSTGLLPDESGLRDEGDNGDGDESGVRDDGDNGDDNDATSDPDGNSTDRPITLSIADLQRICSLANQHRNEGQALFVPLFDYTGRTRQLALDSSAYYVAKLAVGEFVLRPRNKRHGPRSDPSACFVSTPTGSRLAHFHSIVRLPYFDERLREQFKEYAVVYILDAIAWPASPGLSSPTWNQLGYLAARSRSGVRTIIKIDNILGPAIVLPGSRILDDQDGVIATMVQTTKKT
ncbi:hypothetical protein A4X03_0g6048 [Tilletia caries]|uniref:Uncharacterized protein n=3 Tax=Tilletia TaxID=13289 RepID=A0A8T8T093_9BASI|nr:hypothetical protein A4X03_0g6048 [Tilletia caries]